MLAFWRTFCISDSAAVDFSPIPFYRPRFPGYATQCATELGEHGILHVYVINARQLLTFYLAVFYDIANKKNMSILL